MAAARHQYEIYIRATPEQVWEALLDPAFTRQYFHGTAFDRPPVQGEPFRTSLPDGSPAVDGTVEVLDAPRTLVHTWHTLYDAELASEPVSRVEWHVEPAGEGLTRLRLVHGDLAQSPKTWANVEHGWVWILDSMKSLLETGQPLPPAEATAARPRSRPGGGHAAPGLRRGVPLGPRRRPYAGQLCPRGLAALQGAPARRPSRDGTAPRRSLPDHLRD